jgi:hypothetical protein
MAKPRRRSGHHEEEQVEEWIRYARTTDRAQRP